MAGLRERIARLERRRGRAVHSREDPPTPEEFWHSLAEPERERLRGLQRTVEERHPDAAALTAAELAACLTPPEWEWFCGLTRRFVSTWHLKDGGRFRPGGRP